MSQDIIQGLTADEEAQLQNGIEETVEQEEPVAEEKVEDVKVEEKVEEKPRPAPEEIVKNLQAALRETRDEMKGMKRQLDIASDLRKQLEEIRAAKAEPEEPIPAYEDDPIGHSKSKIDEIERANKTLEERLKVLDQTTETQRISNYVNSLETEFKKKTPDYDAAFQHIITVQKKQMELAGVPEDQINQALATQAVQFTNGAIKQGKNPAELIYEFAKLYGYKSAPTQQEQNKAQVDKTVERLETVQKGIESAAKTLSKGGKNDTTPNVQMLLDAKGEDFDKLWKELFDK